MIARWPTSRRHPGLGGNACGSRRAYATSRAGDPGHRRGGGPDLRGRQGGVPATGCHPAHGRGGIPGPDPESAGPGRAGVGGAPPRAGRDRGDDMGPAGLRGPGAGVRLPPGERDQPPGSHPAGLRDQGGARPGLDRAPGAQVPRGTVGSEERTQDSDLRAGPGQTRAHPGQGGHLAAHRAADDFRAGPAPAAGGAEAAHEPAGDDDTRACGALREGGARGQPVGHRLRTSGNV